MNFPEQEMQFTKKEVPALTNLFGCLPSLQCYTNPAPLRDFVERQYRAFLQNTMKSETLTEIEEDSVQAYLKAFDMVVEDSDANYREVDQSSLTKRRLSRPGSSMVSFLEKVPQDSLGAYYLNSNLKNLPSSSKVYKPVLICNCSALPFVHFYAARPNYFLPGKGKPPREKCPCAQASSLEDSPVTAILKSFRVWRPDYVPIMHPKERDRAQWLTVQATERKDRGELLPHQNVRLRAQCSICKDYESTTPISLTNALKPDYAAPERDKKYHCEDCCAAQARAEAKSRREKVSDVTYLATQYSKRNKMPAHEVSLGSPEEVLWDCIGHCKGTYPRAPRRRFTQCDCSCVSGGTSVPERLLGICLVQICQNTSVSIKPNEQVFIEEEGKVFEADILVSSPTNKGIVVEYDGFYYHKDKQDKDIDKSKIFARNGYTVIRLLEPGLAIPESTAQCGYIPIPNDHNALIKLVLLRSSKVSEHDV
ncbi:hypothetical protein MLC59_19605 [Marinobacter bryozoorum]|uniref:hypothetical protein n=1 Tax=Marinobacter bryozoorum TaxID=256324 RepID=UPI0020040390|nr:hypothetical protein [Marinobacter bryozoorum]MCK7546361.1 hypothetical protein [Marinobacter bryozoorum]